MKRTRKNTRTTKRRPRRKTADALRIIDRITGRDPKLCELISQATVNAQVAEMLYAAHNPRDLA